MKALDNRTHINPILHHLPGGLIDALSLSEKDIATIERGHHRVADSAALDAVFLIAEGWAVSKMEIRTGDTQTLEIFGPGSIAGLCRLDDISLDDYSFTALQNVKAYKIDIDALLSVCSKNENLSRWLSNLLVRQTQRTNRHLIALGQLPARGRLAFIMLRIMAVAQQMGQPLDGRVIPLPMTQDDIGNMLGLTNVSVSKIMTEFREGGLIDYSRNRIIIKNVAALSNMCGMTLEAVPLLASTVDYAMSAP